MNDTNANQKQEIIAKIAEITALVQSLEKILESTEDLDLWYFLANALYDLTSGPVDFEGVFDSMNEAQTEYFYSHHPHKKIVQDFLAREVE
ncbi:MAG: hypothetical protein ACRCU2_25305 [Planktothrix sp.]